MPKARLDAGVHALSQRYRVEVDRHTLERTGYLAGDDGRRAQAFNRALADPDVRAIFVARGGYGCMRILADLDATRLQADPKVIVGFSDATAILCWALTQAGIRSVHGPVATQFGELTQQDTDWLIQLLETPHGVGYLPGNHRSIGSPTQEPVSGPLIGGNLTMLAHLMGTRFAPSLDEAIVFIEDVGEKPYAMDRALTSLQLRGSLYGVRAVVAGDFVRCQDTRFEQPSADEVVDERMTKFGLPGIAGVAIGHGERNLALPFACQCTIDFARGSLRIDDGAVA